MGISGEMPFFFFLDSYKISSRRGAEMKNKDPRWLFHWGSFAYKGAVCCPAGLFYAGAACAGDDFADVPGFVFGLFDVVQDGIRLFRVNDGGHADTHVEDLIYLAVVNAAGVLDQFENGRNRPGAFPDDDIAVDGENPRDIVNKAAAGDVGQTFDHTRSLGKIVLFQQHLDQIAVAEMGLEQFGSDGAFESGGLGGVVELHLLKEDLARQGIAVRVETVGGDPDHAVALADACAVEHIASFHNADDGAADIILAGSVKIGHLSRLTADQGAVVLTAGFGKAGDQLLENRGLQFAGADIVQEEERLRAQNSDIIHTVIDQIGAYRVVLVQGKGDLEFGAYAVHAGNQYRLFVLGDFECE